MLSIVVWFDDLLEALQVVCWSAYFVGSETFKRAVYPKMNSWLVDNCSIIGSLHRDLLRWIQVGFHSPPKITYIYLILYIQIQTYVHFHVHSCIHLHTCILVYISCIFQYIHKFSCFYIYTDISMHIYIYICIYIYIYTHL